MKTSTFREQQTVTIHSPRAQVWEYAMDRAKIAEYNPRVARVEPGSGTVMPGSTSAASTSFANGSPRCSLELGEDATIVARKIAERGARREHRPNDTK